MRAIPFTSSPILNSQAGYQQKHIDQTTCFWAHRQAEEGESKKKGEARVTE